MSVMFPSERASEMTYDDFSNQINEYIEVYNKGLKKQANTQIKSVIDFLDNLESSKLDAIFRRFLSEFCDDSVLETVGRRIVFFCDYGLFKLGNYGIRKRMNLPLDSRDLDSFRSFRNGLHCRSKLR